MATEYDEDRKILKMQHKMHNALSTAKALFFVSLGVAALVLAFKL